MKSHISHASAERPDQESASSTKHSMLRLPRLLGACLFWLGCTPLCCSTRATSANVLHLSHHSAPLQETTWEVQAMHQALVCCAEVLRNLSFRQLCCLQCPEDARPLNRVCIFMNLAIYEGNLTVFYKGGQHPFAGLLLPCNRQGANLAMPSSKGQCLRPMLQPGRGAMNGVYPRNTKHC